MLIKRENKQTLEISNYLKFKTPTQMHGIQVSVVLIIEENLRWVIAENRTKISEFGSDYQSNESEVRRTLMEPVLEALGWNVTSSEDVRSELVTEGKQRLDYMLRKKGKDLLIVETKA